MAEMLYVPPDQFRNLPRETLLTVESGIAESMGACDDIMSVEYVLGRVLCGDWALYLIVHEKEVIGLVTVQDVYQGGGRWVNFPVTWTNGASVQRNGSGSAKLDAIGECLKGFARQCLENGYAGIQFASPRRGYKKVAPMWGFRESNMTLWQMPLGGA